MTAATTLRYTRLVLSEGDKVAGPIFINYRRGENLREAQHLATLLAQRFGDKGIFLDFRGLEGGDQWLRALEKQVAASDAMVVLIGKNWIDLKDDAGNRRLDNEGDSVRFELAQALQRDIPVLPVLLDGAQMPKPAQLPGNLMALTLFQAMPLRFHSFTEDAAAIARQLKAILPQRRPRGVLSRLFGGLQGTRTSNATEERLRAQERELREAKAKQDELTRQLENERLLRGQAENILAVAKDAPQADAKEAQPSRGKASRIRLAEVASPAPSLASDGRLDAGPNPAYDVPLVDNDLSALPIRQRTLIKTIRGDLPKNAPKHLKMALANYDEELQVRGVQPIVGLLKDMASIIEAAVGSPDAAREWLPDGMREAFALFAGNHALFLKHFPLDPEREEVYVQTSVDETNATGTALSKPFDDVAKATSEANKAGLTTDDFLKIVDKMAEFAKVISTQPPPQPSSDVRSSERLPRGNTASGLDILPLTVRPEDKLTPDLPPVTAKKRILLSGYGFFERVLSLTANSAQLASPPEGNVLLIALRSAIAALSKLIGF